MGQAVPLRASKAVNACSIVSGSCQVRLSVEYQIVGLFTAIYSSQTRQLVCPDYKEHRRRQPCRADIPEETASDLRTDDSISKA